MAEDNLSFWILTFEYYKNDIKKPEDNLIVLAHWLLLKNGFQVLGPGNEKEIGENEQPSDILPTNWFQKEIFKFRYVHKNTLFLLNGVNAGSGFIFNFYNVTTEHVTSAALGNITTIVEWIRDMVNNKENFCITFNLLQKDLIQPMQNFNGNQKIASTQTIELDNHINESHLFIRNQRNNRFAAGIPRNPFPTYGIPDLDPLGGLRDPGYGMLYEPPRPNRPIGRFPIPRFDQIDPLFIRRPSPDHMRPPDFDENLYM